MQSAVGATESADAGGRPLAEIRRQLDGEIQSLDMKLVPHTRRKGLLFARGKVLLGAQ